MKTAGVLPRNSPIGFRDPQGKFKPQALLCTHPTVSPTQMVQWFILRWQLEVTLEEVRAHLGVETQRQWSDQAIVRTTPALLGLFSLVTLLAHRSTQDRRLPLRQAAWYPKPVPTFSDALAVVRQTLWQHVLFSMCKHTRDVQKKSATPNQTSDFSPVLRQRLTRIWIKSS